MTNSNNKFYSKKSLIREDILQITFPSGAYKLDSLNDEIKRINLDKSPYTEAENPFTIKPNFNTLGSVIEKKPQGAIIGFVFDDSIRNLLGLSENMLFKEYILSNNLVDILSFDKFFFERDIARGRMLFRGKRSNIIHNWTMTVDPGYKHEKKISGGVTWYMMETKDVVSSISLKLQTKIMNWYHSTVNK